MKQLNEFDSIVIEQFPYPIAVNYSRVLMEESWQGKVRQTIRLFEFVVRILALTLIGQYLIKDRELFSDNDLNWKLQSKLSNATLGVWVDIFFSIFQAYARLGRNKFFIPEMFDLFYENERKKINKAEFQRIVEIRNEITHGLPPQIEDEWKIIFDELQPLMNSVLRKLMFFQKYELVLNSGKINNKTNLVIYRGSKPVEQQLDEISELEKGLGWFFIRQTNPKRKTLLKLFPFLLSYKGYKQKDEESTYTDEDDFDDAAIFDTFSSKRIYYLATVLWKKYFLEDESILAEFFYAFEKSLQEKQRNKQSLNLTALQDITAKISQKRMGDATKKYNADIYIQRQHIIELFLDFLETDKTCLVITGKSGVGKTNFVLSLFDEFENSENYFLLAYNGARLPSDLPFEHHIVSDFFAFLNVRSGQTTIEHLFGIINDLVSRDSRKLIILIDAINENPNAYDLLRRLDYFVESNTYSWLKVIIISRPEAWRKISQKANLAEHKYYWQSGYSEMGVQLESFQAGDSLSSNNTSIEIPKFSKNELVLVYDKYKSTYDLKTEYSDLSPQMKQCLKDPLILRIQSEINRGKELKSTTNIRQIYTEYFSALVETKRLQHEDLLFLEQEIVSRMVNLKANTLTTDQITTETTLAGRPLSEMIFSSEKLADGRTINSSFTNLTDCGILTYSLLSREITISFAYERFYDYFIGQYLQKKLVGDYVIQYTNLLADIDKYPYMWGPVRESLLTEIHKGNIDRILELLQLDNLTAQELIINSIVDFCGQDPVSGNKLVQTFYESNEINVRKVAIKSAGMAGLTFLLESASGESDSSVRTSIVQAAYFLWQSQPSEGWMVLQAWSKKIFGLGGIPRLPVLELVLGLAVLIFTSSKNTSDDNYVNYQNQDVLDQFQKTVRYIINRLLWIRGDADLNSRWKRRFRSLFLSALIYIAVNSIERGSQLWRMQGSNYVLSEFGKYFSQTTAERKKISPILDILKQSPGSISNFKEDLRMMFEQGKMIPFLVAVSAVVVGARRDHNQDIETVEYIFNSAFSNEERRWELPHLAASCGHILRREPVQLPSTDAWQKYSQLLKKFLDSADLFVHKGENLQPCFLDTYTVAEWELFRISKPSLLPEYAERVIKGEKHLPSLASIMREIGQLGTIFNLPKLALEASTPLLFVESESDIYFVGTALARIRLHHREIVDDFLEEREMSSNLKSFIQTTIVPDTTVTEVVAPRVGTFGRTMLSLPATRNEIYQICLASTTSVSFESWLGFVLKRILNFLYGSSVFDE